MEKTTNRRHPHHDIALAAASAYGDWIPPKGYETIARFEDGKTGFKGVVLENRKDGSRIYSIAGTEDMKDAKADWVRGANQFKSGPARKMVLEAAKAARLGLRVTFTGHSLGGGLAEAMAHESEKALERWRKSEEFQREPAKISSVSWNGIGGKSMLEKAGESYDEKAARKVNSYAYKVDRDLVHGFGEHIGEERILPADALNAKASTVIAAGFAGTAEGIISHPIGAVLKVLDTGVLGRFGDEFPETVIPEKVPEEEPKRFEKSRPGGLNGLLRSIQEDARQSRERGQSKVPVVKKGVDLGKGAAVAPAPDQPPASRAAAPTKPADGLDRLQKLFGRPFEHLVQTAQGRVPVDDPAILHADEIDSLMASSAYRQSLHPQAEKTRATVGQWHEATYPGAAQHDDTGRMTRPPRRARPQSAPSWIRDHGPLSLQGPERDTLIGALIPGGRRKPRKRV